MSLARRVTLCCLAAIAAFAGSAPARADLVLSELIVELRPGKSARADVEVWNNSPERSFVAVEPREILDPGQPSQEARREPDPEKLGLLVSPGRMILEPGQRKLLRIAALSAGGEKERVYRVMVKPVAGALQSDASGLKILVGYDVLVLVRPAQARPSLSAIRSGRQLTFANSGNSSVEIVDGRQCGGAPRRCADLPGKRLYPGVAWTVQLQSDFPAEYTLKSTGRTERKTY